MSNILIIKHGSLGDIAQASGSIQDIFEHHSKDQIFLLTTKPYMDLFKKNPFIHHVILDKRLSRFRLIYLYLLMNKLKKLNFVKVYDLQNSSRTKFYKNVLSLKSKDNSWSSSETTIPHGISKEEFDTNSVLDRFDHQLKNSGIATRHTKKPNFDWSCSNISEIKKKYDLTKYIILFPFCSPHLKIKKWPYYNDLIQLIEKKYSNQFKIIMAPGHEEMHDAKEINATSILNNNKALSITELSSLIKESSFVVANDTGPAHMAAHLNAKGLTLFGKHTTAKKVSIETENFKFIQVEDLTKLSADRVFEKISI